MSWSQITADSEREWAMLSSKITTESGGIVLLPPIRGQPADGRGPQGGLVSTSTASRFVSSIRSLSFWTSQVG